MNRPLFLLLMAIYAETFGVLMLLYTPKMLGIYEIPVDETSMRLMRFMSTIIMADGIFLFLMRNAENSLVLKYVLGWLALILFSGAAYQVYFLLFENIDIPPAFWIEFVTRVIGGAGCLYYLMDFKKENK